MTTLLEVPEGVVRDPEVSFDGRRILVSLRHNIHDNYHLYELNADGSGLRQLTDGDDLSDIDPLYLPNGQIVFTSTREPKYCMCNRHIMGNLFTMNADGSGIQQIGHSTLHEGHAALLPDGRVIYDRWEYVDRNFGDAQGVWSVNPDGTHHAIFWGNNTNSPGAVLDTRALPSGDRFIATFSSCHDRPWGALALVDRRLGMDGRPPVVRTWPASAIKLVGKGNYDTFKKVQPKYEDPFPLSDHFFLCSRMTGQGEQTGICLLDTFGNEIMLHVQDSGCFDPQPLRPRHRPPAIPARVELTKQDGYFYIADVYHGAGMAAIPRGTIKAVRVVESPEKRFWTKPAWDGGTGQQAPGMAWDDFNNKRIMGTAPVASDGSAYFAVPADTFIYLQLLDQQGRMVQSMRSGTAVRPGETIGCAGCHENRRTAAPVSLSQLTLSSEPQDLSPWYGPPRTFSYRAEVQPVFDAHCVSCHDYGQPAGDTLNLSGDQGLVFNTSYVELRSKGYVNVVGAGPFVVQPPDSWGSRRSRLAQVLLEGHSDPDIDSRIHLREEDVDRVVTWIDINAPYHPEYAGGAFRDRPFGRAPITKQQLERLKQLTGVDLANRQHFAQLSFTRPKISPCLNVFASPDAPEYQEAVAIIRSGQQALQLHARPDMPGFELTDSIEIDQQRRYDSLLQQQLQSRRQQRGD